MGLQKVGHDWSDLACMHARTACQRNSPTISSVRGQCLSFWYCVQLVLIEEHCSIPPYIMHIQECYYLYSLLCSHFKWKELLYVLKVPFGKCQAMKTLISFTYRTKSLEGSSEDLCQWKLGKRSSSCTHLWLNTFCW